jgi:hypothetical protein
MPTQSETDTTTNLLDAVDALTHPVLHPHVQDILDADTGKKVGTQRINVELPSLLTQLEEAIRADMGGSSKGAGDPAWRVLIDGDALYKFAQVTTQIQSWCQLLGIRPSRAPQNIAADLRAWYVEFMTKPAREGATEFHERKLWDWVTMIQGKLDPAREQDLPDRCPSCDAAEWWDPKTAERYPRPLVIRYRQSFDGSVVQRAKAQCRACGEQWGARELAYELEQRHQQAASA